MTHIALVRHGESVWHAENRYAGLSDIELTPRGLDQAGQLASWAGRAGLSGVWASTLSRARITAAASAEAAGVELRVDERLRELDFGQADGLTAAEMRERFPEARAAFEADPATNPLPGGEDPKLAADRFTECLRDIAAAHPAGRVMVVAHTTVIRIALCRLMGVPLGEYRRLFPSLDNCAITEIRPRDGQVAILRYNSPIGALR
ncbi:histidine phosphatase family protein [Nonomuraea aurantiaca]|jgi:probable phosphoglycerate mutase|uniref:histidine phosphatase family protein n=1 Tax=Nonomuraea aurantiaca TaxID=2878562 RepID=UPI001CDA4270|nr:histidine phosphatase family protein [Nonomuraea aurantiaca]MCA2222828.1 histidine phosphatase family protein [Nonomuraea aurantiaca]